VALRIVILLRGSWRAATGRKIEAGSTDRDKHSPTLKYRTKKRGIELRPTVIRESLTPACLCGEVPARVRPLGCALTVEFAPGATGVAWQGWEEVKRLRRWERETVRRAFSRRKQAKRIGPAAELSDVSPCLQLT
jgi:hypothetical protein